MTGTDEPSRSTFSSAWGSVLATAGVAIGLGNIWRFPYMMGRYGGGVFLLVYLVILVAFGLPALMAEWALGRHTRRGPWAAFQRAGLPGGRLCSGLLLLTVVMAGSYYGVVLSRVLLLAVACLGHAVAPTILYGLGPQGQRGFASQCVFVGITAGAAGAALRFGVRKGIESVSRLALPVFFLLFGVLIVRVLSLDGAMDGLREWLVPRWSHFRATTPLAALGQAFFSLGLGGTFMLAYGSYLRPSDDIPRTAVVTAGVDLAAAVMAGLVVVPAAAAFSIPLNSGPPLMFEVMPAVFRRMTGGFAFGGVFFGSCFLVALLSLMAAYEVLVVGLQDALGWTRTRALGVVLMVQLLLAIPALRFESYIEYSDLIWGSTMQPVGGAMAVIALTWCLGQGTTLAELRRKARLPIPRGLFYWLKYVVPVGIFSTLAYGWIGE